MGVTSAFDIKPPSSKMKMFKKVKKRLGLGKGESSANNATNNLPPLLFHRVHGDNVRISRDGTVARRTESFCKGVCFSARPVKIAEKICLRIVDVSDSWSGVVRFGFTSNDPSGLQYNLPKYACPDLTNKPGYWAKALSERMCERDSTLFYYLTAAGDVHFGINGEEKGVFFSGVETRGQLWAMVDIYGNTTAIELLDPREQLNNSRRLAVEEDPARFIVPQMSSMSIQTSPQIAVEAPSVEPTPPPLRYQNPSTKFSPLPFHRTRGKNIRLSNDRCIATRYATEFAQGYVFTARPIQLGEKIVVQVLATDHMYLGALALGLTSCDPAHLSPHDLPDDADLLLDRREYWVVNKDVAGGPRRGDELAFCITTSGEVQMSKNGGQPISLMHIDQSQTLWAFLDIYGSTKKIRILGSIPHSSQSCSPPRAVQPVPSNSVVQTPERCRPVTVATAPGVGGGTLLVVNLPPPTGTNSSAYSGNHHQTAHISYSPTYVEPVSGTSYSTIDSSEGIREWAENSITVSQSSDCSVCYERIVDSVLYTCGHMCMCYECSVQQWRGKGGGHCPLCRAVIRDVIRTFRS
ncbi:protein neuralized isoform X2 [Cimex lectularius]|uniref:Protein neuralized n=1 Tax=Cimex lectularius TaxID=79782 RepID=A0A8I6S1U7_CIMLE|nr:protein neuralized isoform X2 [Cimex lectularius]